MTNSIRNSLNNVLAICLLASLSLAASCGGGGGNGQPNPQPNLPDPVEEISNADLATAGIPDVGSLGVSSAGRSISLNMIVGDWDGDGIDPVAGITRSHNIAAGQDGLVVQVPEGDLGKRIVAWAIYAMPLGDDAHLAWLQTKLESGGNVRWFFALANAGKASWEIGGAVLAETATSQSYLSSGERSTSLQYNFRRSFSQSQDYIFPNGNAYLLLAAGHPGSASISGYINNTELWDWRKINDSASEGFDAGLNGSCSWESSGEGGGIYNSITGEFRYIEQENVYKQYFTASPPEQPTLLFAQPFNLLPDGEPGEPTTALNSVDGADYLLWRYGFFNPGEMNGWQHPFLMQRAGESGTALTAAPLLQLPGGQSLGIIAILIGLTGPIPDADVSLISADDQISLTTGKAGQLLIPLSFFGTDTFTYTLQYGGGAQPLSVELEIDSEAGLYRIY